MNPGPGSQASSDIVNPRSGALKAPALNCDARQGCPAAFAAHSLRSSLKVNLTQGRLHCWTSNLSPSRAARRRRPRSSLTAACSECSCHRLRGVVVHDGFSNLIWASDDWDLADDREVVNEAISNALADTAEFAGIARFDADRAVYSFAMRGEHIELLGVVSLLARLSGARTEGRPLQYVRQLVQPALECLRREMSLRSKLGSRERDLDIRERDLSLMLEMSSNQTATGDADEFDLILKTGLERMGCALAALWVPDKNIALVDDAQRSPDVAGVPAARAAASDGVDAAAAAHHRRQSHLQSGERCGGSVQDTGLSGAPPFRTRHGRSRALQPAERPRLRYAPNARRRAAREAGDGHHSGAIRFRHRPHDPPRVRAPGLGAAGIRRPIVDEQHSLSGHRPSARHQ